VHNLAFSVNGDYASTYEDPGLKGQDHRACPPLGPARPKKLFLGVRYNPDKPQGLTAYNSSQDGPEMGLL